MAGKQQPSLVLKIADEDRKGSFFKQPYEWVDKAGKKMPKPSVATNACAADGTLLNSYPFASGFFSGSQGDGSQSFP